MIKVNKYMSDDYQNFFDNDLSTTDPNLYNSIKLELERQQQVKTGKRPATYEMM